MKTTKRKHTFEEAKRLYVNRFTMEHVPAWAKEKQKGKYYAPQYRTDLEWYENTTFAGEQENQFTFSSNQSWPQGQWLEKPFEKFSTWIFARVEKSIPSDNPIVKSLLALAHKEAAAGN